MATTRIKSTPEGCPICEGIDAVTLEIDRPTVLLCTCARCGKFIVRKDTLNLMEGRGDFGPLREAISAQIRHHFKLFGRPLQIIAFNEVPLAQDAITIGELTSVCREAMRCKAAAATPQDAITDVSDPPLAAHGYRSM